MSNKKVTYLVDYLKSGDGALEGKVVVGSDIKPDQAVQLAMKNKSIQVITDDFDEKKIYNIKDDIKKFLVDPVNFLIDQSQGPEFRFEFEFSGDTEKKQFLIEVESFLKSSKFRKVREDIYLIADELFTNFAKSATDNKSKMKFGIDSDSTTVVVYCRDSFGTLKPKDMLGNIQRCFDKGVMNAIKREEGKGAGIGSYLMYTLGMGMAITVEAGKNSMVSIWMPRNMHHEDRLELNKSLIVIDEKET